MIRNNLFLDCYDECDFKDASSCHRSNRTTEFLVQQENTSACIESSKSAHTDPCSSCNESYGKLNDMYNVIRLKTSDKFCFDIKDAVCVEKDIEMFFS